MSSAQFVPNLPHFAGGFGLSTPYGILLPPGGKVAAYVRSSGVPASDNPSIESNRVATLAAACNRVRSGWGDTIVVLPGHTEDITDDAPLANLVAGTRIVGVGHGSQMPAIRWTNTAAKLTLDQADVILQGLRLRMEGANGIVKAIEVTAADCAVVGCDIEVASGATAKATIMCEAGAGSTRFAFVGNRVRGTAGHNVTDGLLVSAAVSGVYVGNNRMQASATSANGLIRLSAAALSVLIEDNLLFNTMTTAATVAVALGTAAATGVVRRNHIGCLTGGAMTSGTTGISFGGSVDFRLFDNLVSDSANGDGIGLVTDAA